MNHKIFQSSILLQMLYGQICLEDIIDMSEKQKQLTDEYVEKEKAFMECLKDSVMQDKFVALSNLYCEMDCDASDSFFIGGFKLGFFMALEIVGFKSPKNKDKIKPRE